MTIWKHIALTAAGIVSAAVLFGFLIFASLTTQPASGVSPQAEAIVALTGGAQRIKAAGALLRARKARRLLISGVNRVVTPDHLRRLLDIDASLFKCCVDIDYAAQNTRGNAVETRKWAERHEFASIIVVTSSYHMPRSLTELGHLLPTVDLIAHPVLPDQFRDSPWWLDSNNMLLLGAEYLKYLPSAAQFSIGRMWEPPRRKGTAPATQRAVAIQ